MINNFEKNYNFDMGLAAATRKTSKEKKQKETAQLTVDIFQTDREIVIQSAIAGANPSTIDISLTKDTVTIKGNRQPEENTASSDYYHQEIYWGPFSRSIILPVNIDPDKSKANMKNGVLVIRLPKLLKPN